MPLRHRIVSMSAPGVASKDSADGEVKTFDGAVLFQRVNGVGGTRWRVAASAGE